MDETTVLLSSPKVDSVHLDVAFCGRNVSSLIQPAGFAATGPDHSGDAGGGPLGGRTAAGTASIAAKGGCPRSVSRRLPLGGEEPIKNPPTGKKYVRCPCNCLLICKDTSRRIGCPRPNCRRIINLSPVMVIPEEQPAQPALPIQPEGMRVVCGHCGNTFLWMELRFNTLAKCPHCKKISSVGSALPRRRCCAYLTIGMICIFIGVGLTVGTRDFARRYNVIFGHQMSPERTVLKSFE
ncbi:myosin VIIa [Sarotherodon galilaeus]